MIGGANGVDRGLHPAAGTVLEAYRHGETRGQLAMDLALGRACTDGRPGHGVGEELGVMGSRNSVPAGNPSSARSRSNLRAMYSPSLTAKLPSRGGSLIRPFHPTVERGFSKYTRMTM